MTKNNDIGCDRSSDRIITSSGVQLDYVGEGKGLVLRTVERTEHVTVRRTTQRVTERQDRVLIT